MKFECKCSINRCKLETDYIPACCIDSRRNMPNWQPVSDPAPKPLSEAINDIAAQKRSEKLFGEVVNPPLPKLTAAVFDREDCPEWAKYAAVDADGRAFWFKSLPCLYPEKFRIAYGSDIKYDVERYILGGFDATDWQKSLIERLAKEAKLPSWCKVGAWVWNGIEYGIVTVIGDGEYSIKLKNIERKYELWFQIEKLKPARLCPWTDATLPALPFAVRFKNDNNNFRTTIIAASTVGVWLGSATSAISYDELKEQCECLDGSPCGVLEAEVSNDKA